MPRRVLGTLQSLPREVAASGLRSPVLTVVGPVVRFAEALDWFHSVESEAEDVAIYACHR